jgi:hypothetical protein
VCKVLVQARGWIMSRRNNRVVTYLTDEEAKLLSEWAEETSKSESSLLREAVLEYLDHDRTARLSEQLDRIEEKVDGLATHSETETTHTHKEPGGMNQSSGSDAVRGLFSLLQQRHGDQHIIQDSEVTRAIEDERGTDPRTVRRWKSRLRDRGLLWEHPGQDIWTDDRAEWLDWLKAYATTNGPREAAGEAEQYGPVLASVNSAGQLSVTFEDDYSEVTQ